MCHLWIARTDGRKHQRHHSQAHPTREKQANVPGVALRVHRQLAHDVAAVVVHEPEGEADEAEVDVRARQRQCARVVHLVVVDAEPHGAADGEHAEEDLEEGREPVDGVHDSERHADEHEERDDGRVGHAQLLDLVVVYDVDPVQRSGKLSVRCDRALSPSAVAGLTRSAWPRSWASRHTAGTCSPRITYGD
jgi:hypothetical protein